jgi:hypothetical protein
MENLVATEWKFQDKDKSLFGGALEEYISYEVKTVCL